MAFEINEATGEILGATGEVLSKAGETMSGMFDDWETKDFLIAGGVFLGGGALLYLGKKLADKILD